MLDSLIDQLSGAVWPAVFALAGVAIAFARGLWARGTWSLENAKRAAMEEARSQAAELMAQAIRSVEEWARGLHKRDPRSKPSSELKRAKALELFRQLGGALEDKAADVLLHSTLARLKGVGATGDLQITSSYD